eukprot:SAG11_NODE_6065_length_1395_cov_1.732253_2_plen_95_part_00
MADGLSEEEKWHFDLHGWLTLTAAQHAPVPPADVAEMCALCDRWHDLPDAALPPPLASYAGNERDDGDPRSVRCAAQLPGAQSLEETVLRSFSV